MNSEELELSLRTEFENYLKGVLAEMKQEVAQFQTKLQDQIEKHRANVDEAFRAFADRADAEASFDEPFRSSVAEHLRLARDDGARITAEAFAEAENLEKESAPRVAGYEVLRDAVKDISSQTSQSAILKALVQHAAEFAPRGAFFILRNDQLAGWKVFGADESAENAIREIHFPATADTLLSTAIKSLETVDTAAGAHTGDSIFLERLNFGRPDRMCAIPLVARGKAVAALYADYGDGGTHLNREGLETLLRVAGLTVELQAAAVSAGSAGSVPEFTRPENERGTGESGFGDNQPLATEAPASTYRETPSFADDRAYSAAQPAALDDPGPAAATDFAYTSPEAEPQYDAPTPSQFGSAERAGGAIVFDSGGSIESASFEASPFESPRDEDFAPAVPANTSAPAMDRQDQARSWIVGSQDEPAPITRHERAPAEQTVPEREPEPAYAAQPQQAVAAEAPVIQNAIEPVSPVVSSPMPQSRLSDRPVDLPIDVPESERRLHNDARRFARLLVSEIKLYNEKKVQEGRQTYDLYDRLKEAIDRSREMYDKRVQPPVAAKFDYFNYELVNSLAEGNAERLGAAYPGPSI